MMGLAVEWGTWLPRAQAALEEGAELTPQIRQKSSTFTPSLKNSHVTLRLSCYSVFPACSLTLEASCQLGLSQTHLQTPILFLK